MNGLFKLSIKSLAAVVFTVAANSAIAQTVIYTQDFSAGIPSGWQNVDNAGGGVWQAFSDTTNSGAKILSTTGSNGFVAFDSKGYGDDFTPEDASLTSNAINCSAYSVVKLTFQQYFRSSDLFKMGTVKVSNDGSNFTDLLVQSEITTANPDIITLDISAYAANQATVYIRFDYFGDYDYYWIIDDVKLFEPLDNDLAISKVLYPGNLYTSIPVGEKINLGAVLANEGVNNLSGVELKTILAIPGFEDLINTVSISALSSASDSVVYTLQNFTAEVPGTYTFSIYSNYSGTDDDTTNNNKYSMQFVVSDSVYSRDNGVVSNGFGFSGTESGYLGNIFKINNSYELSSISFKLKNPNLVDTVSAVLFAVDSTTMKPTTQLAISKRSVIISNHPLYTLTMRNAPVSITPGYYFVGVNDSPTLSMNISLATTDTIYEEGIGIMKSSAMSDWVTIKDAVGYKEIFIIRPNLQAKNTARILSFNLTSPSTVGIIDQDSLKVDLYVPAGTSVAALAPQINHNGASVSPNTGVAQNFTNPVTYTVTAANSTQKAYMVTVHVPASVSKTGYANSQLPVWVYPNPAMDYLNVELNDNTTSGTMQVYDALGRMVISKTLNKTDNQIDISNLQSNTNYIIEIKTAKTTKQLQIIKQ